MELSAIPWQTYVEQMVYWIVIIVVMGGLAVGGWIVLHVTSFKIKMTYWPVVGRGDNRGIDRPKFNKFRWNKSKTHWIGLWPLFNKREVEPFSDDYIYPGNNIYAYYMDGEYIPASIKLGDKNKAGVISPIPYYARRWQFLQLKQNEMEFTKKGWWDENKTYITAIVTVIICGSLCALTVWWSYEYGAQVLGQAKEVGQNFISNAISSVASQGAPQ